MFDTRTGHIVPPTAASTHQVACGNRETLTASLHRGNHMPTQPLPPREMHARLRRLAAVLAVVTCGVLASAAVVPAAFAMVVPPPGGGVVPHVGGGTARPVPVPPATVRVITAGGMAGWQITLIAVGAAVLAAAAAVLLDRALAARRAASAQTP